MNLRQQIIANRVEELASSMGIKESDAFMRLSFSLVMGKSVHDFDPSDIVDGGQDKQMDIFSIEEQGDSAELYILQTKYADSFSSTALVQLGNGLRWVFQRTRKDLETLGNTALRDKILEYRTIQSSLGPSNIRVHVYFVTNGDAGNLSPEFLEELKGIQELYGNDTFDAFTLAPLGFNELTDLSKVQERQTRRVDADLKVKYDANNPSLIKYYAQDLQGLVCTVPASEIARLVNENSDGAIFDLNIRRFLGNRGAVNKDIQLTCTRIESSLEFWFLNNGITIVCDKFDPVTDPDNPHVKLKNLQIVNGCQTATTIALAQKAGTLARDVRILVRIYQTQDPALVDKIVLTTNNQNQINSRNLRANDPAQLDMERGFSIYGYSYERKPRQFEGQSIDLKKLFTNEYVAQAYLAIVLKTPSDARARKYKVWTSELHTRIFSGAAIEPYIISAVIASRVADWLQKSTFKTSADEIQRLVSKMGSFHVARVAAHLYHGSDSWKGDSQKIEDELAVLEKDPEKLSKIIPAAFELVIGVIKASAPYSADVDRALKSSGLDRDIDRAVHQPAAK